MTNRICTVLCFVASVCIAAGAQNSEPTLIAVNMPKYPPLAHQARIEGVVKLTFSLPASGGTPINVEAESGHTMLKPAAVDNVKTWRFDNHYAVERKYGATFRYRLSTMEVPTPTPEKVTFSSYHEVEIFADVVQGTILYQCSDGPCPQH
jgi:TonB family protein